MFSVVTVGVCLQAIVYNTKRKSLTKTVYNPEALKAAAGKQKFTAKKQQQPLAVKQSQKALQQARMAQMKYQRPTKANGANQPSVAHPHMETYVETRKRRKIEKDKKMTFIQLHKKKSDLLAKQVEQQKLLLTRMSKVTDAGKKKQMYKVRFNLLFGNKVGVYLLVINMYKWHNFCKSLWCDNNIVIRNFRMFEELKVKYCDS